jgi:hypothetical protein
MDQRIQACSHYCERKKDKPYLPKVKESVYTQKIRNYLIRTKSGSFVYRILKRLSRLLSLPLLHKRYQSNNNLGIYMTTACNLSCFNCQTSAGQAPAHDNMTVGQMEEIVNEAIDLEYYWDQIILSGGEPTLHPQFIEILDVLKQYKDFNPECEIVVETNGAGSKVQQILQNLPRWIVVHNSNKKEGNHSYSFNTYNIAPIDTLAYRFSDFSNGCRGISDCYGLCASMYGYYPCSPCMNIARVYGFDLGIKELSLVTEKNLRKQMKILCKYCGWFREPQDEIVLAETMSRSWQRAFAEYKKQKPKLSLYGNRYGKKLK